MIYVHQNHKHIYKVNNTMYCHEAQVFLGPEQTPGSKLEMTRDQYSNFLTIMHNNGWTEQPDF